MQSELALRSKINAILLEDEQLDESLLAAGAVIVSFAGLLWSAMQAVRALAEFYIQQKKNAPPRVKHPQVAIKTLGEIAEEFIQLGKKNPQFATLTERLSKKLKYIVISLKNSNEDLHVLLQASLSQLTALRERVAESQPDLFASA